MGELRVGIGVDAHALEAACRWCWAGSRFEHPRGLAGHSDGDVIAHALIDALLGAAGLGDIGSLFPSEDERWKGADSLDLLARAYARGAGAGWALVNADCVLIGEEPRIAPRREEMQRRLAEAIGAEPGRVTVQRHQHRQDRLHGSRRGAGGSGSGPARALRLALATAAATRLAPARFLSSSSFFLPLGLLFDFPLALALLSPRPCRSSWRRICRFETSELEFCCCSAASIQARRSWA